MSLPNIIINFKSTAATAFRRGARGVVAIVMKHTVTDAVQSVHEYTSLSEVPPSQNTPNTDNPFTHEQYAIIQSAFMGYVNTPRKVIVVMQGEKATDYAAVQNALNSLTYNYLAFPQINDADVTAIVTWFKSTETKAILVAPNNVADSEKVVNFVATGIKTNITNLDTATTAQYTGRIAGLLAGTPFTISSTFAPLAEVLDIDKLSKGDMDQAINDGKFILYHDGEKVKVGRGVNSFTTTTQDKGDAFKKIKIVEAMNMIYTDIKKTCEDSYIGKYANSYDNKCILITAIQGYFDTLALDGILDPSFDNRVEFDIERQIAYLKGQGVDVDSLTEQQIKEYNTADQVFLLGRIKILDAIEDITLNIAI